MEDVARLSLRAPARECFSCLPGVGTSSWWPLRPPSCADFGPPVDIAFVGTDHHRMPVAVLRLEPNPCEAVDPFWSTIFGNALGPFPHPAHCREPAADGPGRDVSPVFDLELRSPASAAGRGPWWRFEQGAQRASHPRQRTVVRTGAPVPSASTVQPSVPGGRGVRCGTHWSGSRRGKPRSRSDGAPLHTAIRCVKPRDSHSVPDARAASIWSCSGCGRSSMVVLGMVRLLDPWWMLGNVHRIIEGPRCPVLAADLGGYSPLTRH